MKTKPDYTTKVLVFVVTMMCIARKCVVVMTVIKHMILAWEKYNNPGVFREVGRWREIG